MATTRARRRSAPPPANRQRRWVTLAAGGIVVALAALIAFRVFSGSPPSAANAPVSDAVLADLNAIPQSTFEQVGRGSVIALPTAVRGPIRTAANGLPELAYIGAEYCPFCAGQRWSMVVALSRFGQFSGLQTSHSASDDIFPNTPTFSFVNSTFNSPYLAFSPVELQTNVRAGNTYSPLQTPTPDQSSIVQKYDAPPYVPAQSAGAIPFVDIADQYVQAGASYDIGVLRGQTPESIAHDLATNPSSPRTQAIIGGANVLTAAICTTTNNMPADVCNSPTIQSLQSALAALPTPT